MEEEALFDMNLVGQRGWSGNVHANKQQAKTGPTAVKRSEDVAFDSQPFAVVELDQCRVVSKRLSGIMAFLRSIFWCSGVARLLCDFGAQLVNNVCLEYFKEVPLIHCLQSSWNMKCYQMLICHDLLPSQSTASEQNERSPCHPEVDTIERSQPRAKGIATNEPSTAL